MSRKACCGFAEVPLPVDSAILDSGTRYIMIRIYPLAMATWNVAYGIDIQCCP